MLKKHKLDNPAWNALSEVHENFSADYTSIKFYQPEYCPFGGSIDEQMAIEGIREYANLVDDFFIIGEKPSLHDTIAVKRNLICNQMLLKTQIKVELKEEIIPLKDKNQQQEGKLVSGIWV